MNRLIRRSLVATMLLLALLAVPSIASADSILWTLTGVTFQSVGTTPTTTGGTVTGTFDYNFATNTFSNINLVSTTGSGFAGATYTGLLGAFPSSSTGLAVLPTVPPGTTDLTGFPVLELLFGGALTNSGGTVTIPLTKGLTDGGGEGNCSAVDCSSATEVRFITGGAATSTVGVMTPEPTALSLLGVGLVALLAGAALRKASQA